MKRLFDLILASVGLIMLFPIFVPVLFLVWIQDYKNPFYIADRVGLNNKTFKMIKIRSMVINADKSGVQSTSNDDSRITYIGKFIRKFKLDELSQLINVILGDMSFVGPRPNVIEEVNLYSLEEKKLLTVRPGITDFSSIVFSDEGSILEGADDPDLKYNQLIRPGKGYLGLFYVENSNLILDIKLIIITGIAILSKDKALKYTSGLIKKYEGDENLIKLAERKDKLVPMPPPGMDKVVVSRKIDD